MKFEEALPKLLLVVLALLFLQMTVDASKQFSSNLVQALPVWDSVKRGNLRNNVAPTYLVMPSVNLVRRKIARGVAVIRNPSILISSSTRTTRAESFPRNAQHRSEDRSSRLQLESMIDSVIAA
jgi:hypothetical protein